MTLKRTPIKRKPAEKTAAAQARISSTWPIEYLKEKEFQTQVEADAAKLGWMCSHSHLPFFDTAGWPDCALVHPVKKRFMVRELKVTTKDGKVPSPSPVQWRWLTALAEAGVDAGVWTWPQDAKRYLDELMR